MLPFLSLFIILYATACASQEGGLTSSDNGDTRIIFEEQQTMVEHDDLSLAPGESSHFLIAADTGDAYSFAIDLDQDVQLASEVRDPNGEQLTSGHGHLLDWRSSRTTSGDFRVILTNEGDAAIAYGVTTTRTLPTANQLKLDDLIAKFVTADISVKHTPSVQQPTVFDELYGQDVTTEEILYFDFPHQRVDVYIFTDEQMALEATDTIERGANQLVRGSDQVPLHITNGSIPLWWRDGPFLLYTTGPDDDLEQKLTNVLGPPLGTPTTDSANLRISNRTDSTLTNVRLWSDTDEIVFAELLAGVSGYYPLAVEDTFAVSAEYEGQISTAEMAALSSGDHTLDILAMENKLLIRTFDDRDFYTATDLIDQNWVWQHTDLADGSRFTPVLSTLTPSYLRFGTATIIDTGESGLSYGGNMGCNGMGGTYFVTPNDDLLLNPPFSTDMLCEDEAMVGEYFWKERITSIYRYTVDGDTLRLFVANGDVFVFEREVEMSDENRIYRDILSEWGNDAPILVVAESAAGQQGATPDDIRATLTELFGHRADDMQTETVDDFLARNDTPTALPDVLTLDANITFVTQAELDELFANGTEAGWEAIAAQYNNVKWIFTFSLPGFNAAGDQAIVYYGLRYRNFNGGYYVLKSNGGRTVSIAWSED